MKVCHFMDIYSTKKLRGTYTREVPTCKSTKVICYFFPTSFVSLLVHVSKPLRAPA